MFYSLENKSITQNILKQATRHCWNVNELSSEFLKIFKVICPFLNGYRDHRVIKPWQSRNRPVTVALHKRDKFFLAFLIYGRFVTLTQSVFSIPWQGVTKRFSAF